MIYEEINPGDILYWGKEKIKVDSKSIEGGFGPCVHITRFEAENPKHNGYATVHPFCLTKEEPGIMKIYFHERKVGSFREFPHPAGFIYAPNTREDVMKGEFQYHKYRFFFCNSVAHNGWWAENEEGDLCRVTIEIEGELLG